MKKLPTCARITLKCGRMGLLNILNDKTYFFSLSIGFQMKTELEISALYCMKQQWLKIVYGHLFFVEW